MQADVRMNESKKGANLGKFSSNQSSHTGSAVKEKGNSNELELDENTRDSDQDPDSIYWKEPKITQPFPFLYRPTVPFPSKMCGVQTNSRLSILTLLLLSVVVVVVLVGAAMSFNSADSTRVTRFLDDGVNVYVGPSGLITFVLLLLAWSMCTGYALLRTGDIDLFGFFHLLAPPGLGLFTLGIFTDDIGDAFWGGPIESPGAFYTLAIFIPLATLGSGYAVYILWSGQYQCRVLYDTLTFWYGASIPVTILKFAFAGAMEEVGWSGFLFPQLLHATRSYIVASLISGLIWGLWHIPLVIGGGYNNNISPYWAAFMMPWMTTPWAFFHMW
eukprot:CAMPEP_0184484596 /NCGR_PEP_ID=MMETSP0113_2-20130426/6295_1 /TAXON_ID=91329 /ORGANISM="Norrisiella sphaerica, Strain BC52" /LENGTH=329 /DNA_ID=CAMNT_0026865649 /DNA_START=121 /DNA_END=1107 /DNA_ORIENTATION=-